MVMCATRRVWAVVLLAALACACRADEPRHAGLDTVERIVGAAGVDASLPVVIAVPGLGDTPESFCGFLATNLQGPLRLVCPRAPNVWGKGYSWFPPLQELRTPGALARAIEDAGEAVAVLSRRLAGAPNTIARPVLVGYSQGGMVAFYLAAAHADIYFGVVPIAGMLPPSLRAPPRGEAVPLFAFHGQDDELVPIAQARATIETLRSRWPQAELQVYPGVGHRLSERMRADVFLRLNALISAAAGR